MRARLSRQALCRARGVDVLRLARFCGVRVERFGGHRQSCTCASCVHRVVDALVRHLEVTEGRKRK